MAEKKQIKNTTQKVTKRVRMRGKDSKGRYVIVNGKKCYNEEEFREEINKGTDD